MLQELRTFVMRGNVLDLAVAVVVGAAFGKIVSSFVSDVLMPPIGLLLGRVDFSNLFVSLSGESYPSLAAAKAAGAPTLNYGLFLNTVLEFVIVAFAVFLLVRQVNRLRRPVAAPAPPDTRECPFCATAIPARARRCPNCTSALTLLVVVGALALAAPALAQTAPSPYTGQDGRDLKALAPEEVRSLLAGEGMGFAKSAELNRYPGPRHVLDLAGPLRLTDEQRRATQAVYERMRERARGIGAAIVERERRLDALFAAGTIDEASLRVLTAEIGRLTGELRELHLTAHLETRRLLTYSQVAAYDRLRGYDGSRERGGDVEGQPAGAHGGHRP